MLNGKKKFQVIDWKDSNFDEGKVVIESRVFENLDDLNNLDLDDSYAIAIGYNPSNKTSFNDDETNLYLRDKIRKLNHGKYKGYILVNLIPEISSNMKQVGDESVDKDYISELVKLISGEPEKTIILFFGKAGVNLINKGDFNELMTQLSNAKDRIYCAAKNGDIVHPGRRGDGYELIAWKEDILDKN